MNIVREEFGHLWHILVGRGVAMLVLGIAAVVWPEPFLIGAMVLVGVFATLVGLYDVSIGVSLRKRSAGSSLILIHGIAFTLFGAMTIGAPRLSMRVALILIEAWMLLYAGIVWSAAIMAWPRRELRWTLFFAGCFNILVALICAIYPEGTIFALLFFGAAYAAMLGALQIVAGLWLHRRLGHSLARA